MATTTCPYCQSEIAEGVRKCAHCGEWVAKDDARRARGDMHPVVKLIAVLLMVAIAAMFVMNFWG